MEKKNGSLKSNPIKTLAYKKWRLQKRKMNRQKLGRRPRIRKNLRHFLKRYLLPETGLN